MEPFPDERLAMQTDNNQLPLSEEDSQQSLGKCDIR